LAGNVPLQQNSAYDDMTDLQAQSIVTGRSADVDSMINDDYTAVELSVRNRLWCRSYAGLLACGALFWWFVWWLA
jgi:hypothetical protein